LASAALIQRRQVARPADFSSRGSADEGREGNPPSRRTSERSVNGGKNMYSIVEREDTIRIPAEYIREGQSLVDHIDSLANDAFEGRFDADENYTVLTFDHKPVGRGRIIHGDGAIYQAVSFKALLFNMENNEVVDGYVSDVSEYGAFVRIGPVEALLHKSQILDEPIQVNMGVRRIEGAQSGKHIEEGSHVRSRVVSKAINQNDPRASKIGLNCKMDGLGAASWLKETD
tara:strand:+ start:632 stop:1321 length:690 start_codon:yes stop_codon:yes gene_type:complete